MKLSRIKNALIVALLLLAIAAIIFWLIGGVILFSYYKPTYLPPDISIKQMRLSTIKDSGPVLELNFRIQDWVYGITEYQANGYKLENSQQNYDPTSVSYTCSTLQSPMYKEFRLCHSIDYGTIGRYEITQINGNTVIKSAIPVEASRIISLDDINKYVDSFERVPRLLGPVLPRKPGP